MELLAVLVLLLVAMLLTLPAWPYARRWGFYACGACGAGVLAIVTLVLSGYL